MNRKYSLKDKKTISAIFQAKKGTRNYYFSLLKNDTNHLPHPRFALSIGRKFGNAVARNLAKRRVRAILSEKLTLFQNCDCLLIIKPTSSILPFAKMKTEINKLLIKSGILK